MDKFKMASGAVVFLSKLFAHGIYPLTKLFSDLCYVFI